MPSESATAQHLYKRRNEYTQMVSQALLETDISNAEHEHIMSIVEDAFTQGYTSGLRQASFEDRYFQILCAVLASGRSAHEARETAMEELNNYISQQEERFTPKGAV